MPFEYKLGFIRRTIIFVIENFVNAKSTAEVWFTSWTDGTDTGPNIVLVLDILQSDRWMHKNTLVWLDAQPLMSSTKILTFSVLVILNR